MLVLTWQSHLGLLYSVAPNFLLLKFFIIFVKGHAHDREEAGPFRDNFDPRKFVAIQ